MCTSKFDRSKRLSPGAFEAARTGESPFGYPIFRDTRDTLNGELGARSGLALPRFLNMSAKQGSLGGTEIG